MLPFFEKLSEKIKEKVYSLLMGPSDTKRKRTIEMDPFTRGPRAKKQRMNQSVERDGDGDVRKRFCVNNNHEENRASDREDSEVGVFSRAREVKTQNESDSPLKALLSIKKEQGGFSKPRARNPYSVRHGHTLGSRRVVTWTEDQLEILRSALASFRYNPRATTERVYRELRVSHRGICGLNKEDVRIWLSRRCNYDCSQRLLSRKRKIEEIGEVEACENKKTRKVRFSDQIQQKYFSILETPAAVEENRDVVYVPTKE